MPTPTERITAAAVATGHPDAVAQFLRNVHKITGGQAIDLTHGDHIWTGAWADLADEIDGVAAKTDRVA